MFANICCGVDGGVVYLVCGCGCGWVRFLFVDYWMILLLFG